jgi:glutamate-ammonia-ligase adenylyltransferase
MEIDRIKGRIEKELAPVGREKYNVKTSRGGLIELEFAVQYLQLIHGATCREVRTSQTTRAIETLARCGFIPPVQSVLLQEAHMFLRRLENRLRIVHDRSINELPQDDGDIEKLGRRMGLIQERTGDVKRVLMEKIEQQASIVHEFYLQTIDSTSG